MQNFVHLRMHSEYSITDGILRIKDAVKHAHADNMLALGLSDLHNLFALVKFYKACRNSGIKPIVSAEVYIQGREEFYKIILIAKNISGYRQLCDLITRSYVNNKISDIPYIKEEWLFNEPNNDLIALSGFIDGDIGKLISAKKILEAEEKANLWAKFFPDNYYLEIQRFNRPNIDDLVLKTVDIAVKLDIPLVATHPIQFSLPTDHLAHEVRVAVGLGERIDDEKRVELYASDQYFQNQAQMIDKFSDIPSAILNSVEIAKRCNVEITLGEYFLPNFATPNNIPLDEHLSNMVNAGLNTRLSEMFVPDSIEYKEQKIIFHKRLEIEIKTIIQMGFAGYFLIVADFITWAKANDVPVGPGRGSGAGSLVAFSLGITDVEPLSYSLLFERFLNPERVSMPDFDIDFCQDKRELVIEYVKNKYGADSVAQIATFGTMTSKAVIKDVGRVLGLPYGLCDSLTKLIMSTPAKSYSLLEAYAEFPELKQKIDNADDDVKRLWELSVQLEDLPRSVGKHAAGVLIAPGKLSDFCPLYLADGMQTSQLDKDDVESVGLVKFDFLGLRNLTIIKEAVENIRELHGVDVKLSNYDFTDKGVYELMQAGNTTAVFQLESQGMRRLLVKLEPDRFDDIIAVLALYRPGPLGSGMVDDFIKRKKGEADINYFHPDLTECLEPTYGVIVYQEQVMQISQIIGGYTLGGADLLRRAMGKKKPEEMAKHKNLFMDGAKQRGYDVKLAENLFDLMAKFAEYGFNKSHTAAYAVVSYHTAYLKHYYKATFMAATLSSELDKTDKLYEFYQDCVDNNLTILPPDVNQSVYRFKAIDNNTIRYALGAIKGIGAGVVELIENERERGGLFTDFIDFCRRMDKKALSKKTLEGLVKSGAFDSLEANRAKLFYNIEHVLEFVNKERENANQGSLFDMFADDEDIMNSGLLHEVNLVDYPFFTLKEQLTLEKQAIGYYLTASLFDEYKEVVKKLDIIPLSKYKLDDEDMQELINRPYSKDKPKVLICGVINYIGSRPMKKGGKIVFVNLEDDSSELEFVLFDTDAEKYKDLIKMDAMVCVEGELMYDSFRDQIKLTGKQVYTLDEAIATKITGLHLMLNHEIDVDSLANCLFSEDNSGTAVNITANYNNSNAKCRLNVAKKITLNFEKLNALNDIVGKHSWSLSMSSS